MKPEPLLDLEVWRKCIKIKSWEGFDRSMKGWTEDYSHDDYPRIFTELARIIDFLARRVQQLEEQLLEFQQDQAEENQV
jgi:hypothetical protein